MDFGAIAVCKYVSQAVAEIAGTKLQNGMGLSPTNFHNAVSPLALGERDRG